MEENTYGFSIFEQLKTTNQELTITYTPASSIKRYSYEIIKDGEVIDSYTVNENRTSNIVLNETGQYEISVTTINNKNKSETFKSGTYRLDFEKPIIKGDSVLYTEQLNEEQLKSINFNDYITAYDEVDGDLTNNISSNIDEIDFMKIGNQELVYTVSDEAGNVATKTVLLNITKSKTNSLLIIQWIIILNLVIIFSFIFRYLKSIKLEKRISKYSIKAIKGKNISLFDSFNKTLRKWNHIIGEKISKSVFIQKYSEKYDKYSLVYSPVYENGIDFVVMKIMSSVALLIVAIFSKTIQYKILEIYEIFIPLAFGFFLPDFIFYSKYKKYYSTLENDLLQAIIIMNNAFKSGRSITQAIDLVTKELKGPMAEEFKKMSMELSFGLSIDVVFQRFSERVKLDEVTYLTASLSILNKTGGNIIKVFSSIEKTLFNKKKLNLELKALTGSSKVIAYALFVVPFLFIVFISLIDPSYFQPLYTNPLGLILSGVMIVIYILYIICIKKIMKVRM